MDAPRRKFSRRTFLHLAAGAAALPAVSLVAILATADVVAAQGWPARPMTMVVPFAAGGEADVIGRVVAQRLSEALGKPVVVENVGGAGGATGTARVAKAGPDGYQFLFAGRGQFVQTLSRTPLYAVSDFAPVTLIAETPILLIARNDLPAGNLAEFIAYTKANQAKMQYGSPGAGSTPHLTCVLFNTAIGVDVTHVPYRGGGAAMQDLLAGRIDYQCTSVVTAMPQIEGTKVKAIALLTKERSLIVPTLASAHEQGLADFDASVWYGLFLPRGTPGAIVQNLHDATVAAMNTPSVRERLQENGATVVAAEQRSPAYLEKFVVSEIKKWAAAIKAAGVSAD